MQKTQRKKRNGVRAARSREVKAGRKRTVAARQPGAAVKPDNWLDTYVPYHLYRVTNKLNARLLKRLKTRRINSSQWRVLSVLRAYGSLSITRIVQATLLEQPTTSRVVAQLERLGHVWRRPSELDSRVTEISITPAGLEAFGGIVPSALKHQTLAFQDISPRKMALLMAVLQQIEHNITRDD
jgi:DNA-binding MarR family transcriptional regulator